MISTVPRGRFYKIFVSPMLHEGKEFSWSQATGCFRLMGVTELARATSSSGNSRRPLRGRS